LKYLLDTCTFLWLLRDAVDLSPLARDLGSQGELDVFVSAVSIWELLVKHNLGKMPLPPNPREALETAIATLGYTPLPLTMQAMLHLPKLPAVHRDPFDRMLICQAIEGGMTLITPDPEIRQYPISTVW
jgi:PIN domain nuclease of toxin-antitoxin system